MTESSDASMGIQKNLESRRDLSPELPLRRRKRKIRTPVRFLVATEVGPLCEESGELGQGIMNQPVAGEVQLLCSTAIAKADGWSASKNVKAGPIVENTQGAHFSGAKTAIAVESNHGVRIQDLGKTVGWTKKQGFLEGLCGAGPSTCHEDGTGTSPEALESSPYTSLGLDLNIAQVPHCNEVAAPLVGSAREEQTDRALVLVGDENCVGQVAMSRGRGESENVVLRVEGGEARDFYLPTGGQTESARLDEAALDSDNILVIGPPSGIQDGASHWAEKLERCVETILLLEKSNHITPEFRLNFLTWYGRRSTEWEKMIVNTYIKCFDEPGKLAKQLIHTFSATI